MSTIKLPLSNLSVSHKLEKAPFTIPNLHSAPNTSLYVEAREGRSKPGSCYFVPKHDDRNSASGELLKYARRWGADHVLIEKASSGYQLLDLLDKETTVPIVPVPVDTDKVARVARVSASIEGGRVYLPKDQPWIAEFLLDWKFLRSLKASTTTRSIA